MTSKKNRNTRTKNRNTLGFLSRLDIDILFCIAMGANTNKQLHAKLKKRKGKQVPKSTISDHTTKLAKQRLIAARKLYNIRQFALTDHGKLAISNFMARGQGVGVGLGVRGHGFGFVCEMVRMPQGLKARLEEGNWVAFYPKNRVAYKQRLMGCMVIFNPRSVQFLPPEVYGPSAEASFDQALRLVLKVKDFLEQEEFPGLVLGSPQQVARVTGQHYANLLDPLAVEYFRNSQKTGVRSTYRSDRLAVDLSLGVPETETVHRAFAKDDLAKITEFYERYIRGDLSWGDLEVLRRQLPRDIGRVMQRLDVLDKGHAVQDQVLGHLASNMVLLTANVEKLVKTLKPVSKRRKRRKRKPFTASRKADQKVDEIRRKVEDTLARLQETEAET